MYCDRCGSQLQEGQKFCSSCGKPLAIAVMPAGGAGGRVARHLNLLAILWFVASALNLIGGGVLLILANTLFRRVIVPEAGPAVSFLPPLLSAVALLLLLKAVFGFASAWGLLQREAWARTAILVLAFLSLLNIPFGTALGIYTIWVLLAPEADQEYRQLSRAA